MFKLIENYFKKYKREEYLRGYDYALGVLFRKEKTIDELNDIIYGSIDEFDKGIKNALIDFERNLGDLSKWKKLLEDTTIGIQIAQNRAEKLNQENLEINIQLEKLKSELKGPDDFETWKDAAICERTARKNKDAQIKELVALIKRLLKIMEKHKIKSNVVTNTLDFLFNKGFKNY
jgi:hypothetical protein